MNTERHAETARKELAVLTERLQALRAGCFANNGEVTSADVARYEELKVSFANLKQGMFGEAEELARTLFGKRFLSAEDYYQYLAIPKSTIFPLAPLALLDKEFLAKLNGPCPFDKGRKLHESHLLLTPPPENFTLNALSEAVGGQAGQVLYSEWFLQDPIGREPCEKKPFALIPATGEFAAETKNLGHAASRAALLKHYPDYAQADALRLSTALILHAQKNGERLHADDMGWCEDLYGAGSALSVGYFDAGGLGVYRNSFDDVSGWLGCAALRNIGGG